jgi:hypothetical protein
MLDVQEITAEADCRAACGGLVTRTVVPHHGPHPARDLNRSVRAGSAGHREPLAIGGREWSRPASKNRRPEDIHPPLFPGAGIRK